MKAEKRSTVLVCALLMTAIGFADAGGTVLFGENGLVEVRSVALAELMPWRASHTALSLADEKVEHLGGHNPRLHTDETLEALSICAVTDPMAERAMEQLGSLRGCEAHSTVILARVDENLFQKLGVNVTCEPRYQIKKLFHG